MAAAAHAQPAHNVTAVTQPGWRRSRGGGLKQGHPGRPGSAGRGSGRSPRCPWQRRGGRPGAGEVRGFPENKAAAGSQHRRRRGGRVPRSRSSWGREKAKKKHWEFVFYLPGNPGSIPGMSHRDSPARSRCCGRCRAWGRRSSIPQAWGDVGRVTAVWWGGPGPAAELATAHAPAAQSAWPCFNHVAPSSLPGDRAQIPCGWERQVPCPRRTGQPHGSWPLSCITGQASFPSRGWPGSRQRIPQGTSRD